MDIKTKVENLFKELTMLDQLDDCCVPAVNDYIKMSNNDIIALSESDCEQISFEILQHSLFVQKKVNLIRATLDFLKWQLKKEIVGDLTKIKGLSWDNAEILAIKENEYASSVNEQIQELQMMLTASYGVVEILQNFSKRFEAIKYGKRTYTRNS